MSWRIVVISERAKLDLRLNNLVIRKEETVKIHLGEISVLIIESTAVSLTAALLSELTQRKIKVIFCDEKRNPCAELIPCYGSHDTSEKVRCQVAWSQRIKELAWLEIVTEKIRKQRDLLRKLGMNAEADMLNGYATEVMPDDSSNREGHAAKVYFKALFGSSFTRSADNALNAALNYGYSILLSAFNREISAAGYITQLGLFHGNMFNPFNLASDLIETYRPIVDKCVYGMMPKKLEREEKMRLVNILNEEVVLEGRKYYVNNAIRVYCKSVFDAMNGNDISLIRFYRYEL